MKPEQKIGMTSTAIGVAAGVVSALLGSEMLAIGTGAAGYAAAFFLSRTFDENKKLKWIVTNSLPSFFLVWLTSWIIAFNVIG